MSNWQPIETAPKDTRILIYITAARGSKGAIVLGTAHIAKLCRPDKDRDQGFMEWCDDRGQPFVATAEIAARAIRHWMPLPDAPQ